MNKKPHDSGQVNPSAAAVRACSLNPSNPGEGFLEEGQWALAAEAFGLTDREVAVAALVLKGLSRKELARRLGSSPQTVRVHLDHLFEKLQVEDRLGLGLRFARIREASAGIKPDEAAAGKDNGRAAW